jgi:hypothetical protein
MPGSDPNSRSQVTSTWTRTATLRIITAGSILLLMIVYLIAIPIGLVSPAYRFNTPEIILVSVLLLALLLFAQTAYTVKDLTLGTSGVTAHFERIEARQNRLELEVRILQIALAGLVTKFQLVHLQKLASDGPAIVRFGNIMLDELTHLDAIQFIRPIDSRGLNALRDDHDSGLDDFDMKQYVEITKEGREYLALRTQLAARLAESPGDQVRS